MKSSPDDVLWVVLYLLVVAVAAWVTWQVRLRKEKLAPAGRFPGIRLRELRVIQTLVIAVTAVLLAWIIFRRPPAPIDRQAQAELRELRAAVGRCCRTSGTSEPVMPAPPPDPDVFGITGGEAGVVAAILFGGTGLGLFLLGDPRNRRAGGAMLALSGLLTMTGTKLLPLDKIFDVDKILATDTLLTVHANRTFHEASPGPTAAPASPVVELEATIEGFPTARTELPSTDAIDRIRARGVPAAVVLIGRADRRELRNAVLAEYRTNLNLARRRAEEVAAFFRYGNTHIVTAAAPPQHDDAAASEAELRSDRAVTIHAFFTRVAAPVPPALPPPAR